MGTILSFLCNMDSIMNSSMINSNTQYHHNSSSDEDIEDLDARISRYANITSKPIGQFTDTDPDSDTDSDDDDKDSSDSSSSSHSDEIEQQQQEQQSFNVSVRCRPLFATEKMLKYKSVIKVVDAKYVILKNPEIQNKNDYMSMRRDRHKQFKFDHVFDANVSTGIVYKHTAKGLIKSVLCGYNGTVFAYGATGSGKTYTMLGDDNNVGVMLHTLRDLFLAKEKEDCNGLYNFRIFISFLEIYNEKIMDLLVKKSKKKKSKKKYLELRESPKQGVIVSGITFKPVNGFEQVMNELNAGNRRRSTESTAANAVSSRSHAVLQVYVERKSKDLSAAADDVRCGKLNLIDLAGSEKGSVVKSGNKSGMREGANINKSLLALSKCINCLVEKRKFVPYRDSKLTRLLQDALGGNCKTTMICNISPSSNCWDDTMNTLKYADKAKNIKLKKIEINRIKNSNKNDLNTVISALKTQVNALKIQLTVTEKEKKIIKRRSKLMIKEQKQNQLQSLQSFKADSSFLTFVREKFNQTMQICEAMYDKLSSNEDFNQINVFAQNANSKILTESKQKSESQHFYAMIERESELFLAKIKNKEKEHQLKNQENKLKNLKIAQQIELNQKQNEKEHQLKKEYEDKMKMALDEQAKQNELKLKREIDELQKLKNVPKKKIIFERLIFLIPNGPKTMFIFG